MAHPFRRKLTNFYVPGSGQWMAGLTYAVLVGVAATATGWQWSGPAETLALCERLGDEYCSTADQLNGWVHHALPLVVSSLAAAAVAFISGIVVTHRVYGPAWRISRFLDDVLAGRNPAPLKLRRGDHLAEVAERVQRVVNASATPPQSTGSR